MTVPKNYSNSKTTTRKQLQGLGASRYHAVKVTQFIEPVGRQGQAYLYPINEVISSIREYLERPRLKAETHKKLVTVSDTLTNLLGNVIPTVFRKDANATTSQLSKRLIKAMAKTDTSLAALKLDAADIKAEYSLSINQP